MTKHHEPKHHVPHEADALQKGAPTPEQEDDACVEHPNFAEQVTAAAVRLRANRGNAFLLTVAEGGGSYPELTLDTFG